MVRLTCGVKFCNMDRKELEVEVERILLKKARRRKLTKREELILAYTHYAGGFSACYAIIRCSASPVFLGAAACWCPD